MGGATSRSPMVKRTRCPVCASMASRSRSAFGRGLPGPWGFFKISASERRGNPIVKTSSSRAVGVVSESATQSERFCSARSPTMLDHFSCTSSRLSGPVGAGGVGAGVESEAGAGSGSAAGSTEAAGAGVGVEAACCGADAAAGAVDGAWSVWCPWWLTIRATKSSNCSLGAVTPDISCRAWLVRSAMWTRRSDPTTSAWSVHSVRSPSPTPGNKSRPESPTAPKTMRSRKWERKSSLKRLGSWPD